jgi:hypothetical protein
MRIPIAINKIMHHAHTKISQKYLSIKLSITNSSGRSSEQYIQMVSPTFGCDVDDILDVAVVSLVQHL